jgi:acetyl-CoA acetyltransferase
VTSAWIVDACRTPIGRSAARSPSGIRLAAAAAMCIGVGQGIATIFESPR